MDVDTTTKVKIADLAVRKGEGTIITVGLGSCVGVALYDEQSRVGGLAHVLLADSNHFSKKGEKLNPAKYADTALPLLAEQMEREGGSRRRLVGKIAGGSKLFGKNSNIMGIGEKNIEMVRHVLKQMNIPILAEDVGGTHGRTMKINVSTGEVAISTVGRGEKKL